MPPEGGVHGNPHDKCAKMCRRYVGSAIWRRSVKKKSGKNLQGKNYRGGCNNPPPLGCIRVSTAWHCLIILFVYSKPVMKKSGQKDFKSRLGETSQVLKSAGVKNRLMLAARLFRLAKIRK